MDNEIISKFYANQAAGLRAFFMARTANKDLSEDMTQDVFVRLMGYGQMLTEQTLPSLAYTVARRMLTDFYRHRHAVDRCERMLTPDSITTNDPHEVCSGNQLVEILEKGIEHLPEPYQQIYRLHIYEGLKVSGISEQTHLRYKVVEYRLGVARREIKAYMRTAVG